MADGWRQRSNLEISEGRKVRMSQWKSAELLISLLMGVKMR
jgi:hypothetical protein